MIKPGHVYKPLLGLLIFSLAWKLFLLAQIEVINPDGARYLVAVNKFLNGEFMLSMKLSNSLLYIATIAAMDSFIGDAILSGWLLSVLSGAFTVVPLYLVIMRLSDQSSAFWGTAAFVVASWYNEYSLEIIRGPLFLLLFMWALWFALRALDDMRIGDFFCLGLFIFLASMIRIEGALFYPVFLIYMGWLGCRQRVDFKHILLSAVSFLIFPLVGVVAFIGYTGLDPLSIQKTVIISDFFTFEFLERYHQVRLQLKDVEKAFPGGGHSYNIVALARHYMPILYIMGLMQAVVKMLYPLFVVPLVVGLVHIKSMSRHHKFLLILACSYFGMAFALLIYKNWISHRYLQVVPLLLYPLAGIGLMRLLKYSTRPIAGKLVLLFFAACFILPLSRSFLAIDNKDLIVKQVGEWLGSRAELEGLPLVCKDARIPFYAGRERDFWEVGGKPDSQRLFNLAERKKFDLVIVETSLAETELPGHASYGLLKEFTDSRKAIRVYLRADG